MQRSRRRRGIRELTPIRPIHARRPLDLQARQLVQGQRGGVPAAQDGRSGRVLQRGGGLDWRASRAVAQGPAGDGGLPRAWRGDVVRGGVPAVSPCAQALMWLALSIVTLFGLGWQAMAAAGAA